MFASVRMLIDHDLIQNGGMASHGSLHSEGQEGGVFLPGNAVSADI
ncbi:MAG: hypothetical protein JWN25_2591 [Verrucomicrobiales bacterium]|nr:hypothetical protein [Verrucomicrobiales bacterium]